LISTTCKVGAITNSHQNFRCGHQH